MKITTLLACALIVAACATPREPGSTVPAVGAVAPALELPLAGGESANLHTMAARGPVVLVFYRGLF
jgi:hypothetical protein